MKTALYCEIPVELLVNIDLLGCKHKMQFEGREICISLPGEYSDCGCHGMPSHVEDRAKCTGWNRNEECIELSVSSVILTVSLTDEDGLEITKEMIDPESRGSNIFSEKNGQDKIDKIHKMLSSIAYRAFDYWARVIRWKTKNSFFGAPIENNKHYGFNDFFASLDPLKRLGARTIVMSIYIHDSLSIEEWTGIQECLQRNEQPPLWIDAYNDARRREEVGDMRGAFLEAAISMESFLKKKLLDSLESLPPSEVAVRKNIERWHISDVLKNHRKIGPVNDLSMSEDVLDLLKKTFDKRNAIMHGKSVDLDEETLRTVLATIRDIIKV